MLASGTLHFIMCGIAGILYGDPGAEVDRTQLERMTSIIRHRGPDGEGLHLAPGIDLGHRRLAIIDPAADHQPMLDPDTSNVIVYNGEVYNYVEIRAELEAAGHRFRAHFETEVILKAYVELTPDCRRPACRNSSTSSALAGAITAICCGC